MKKMFSYAIFDMDGLMFDTENLFINAFHTHTAQVTGTEFPVEKLKQLLGLNYQSIKGMFHGLFGENLDCDECYRIANAWIKEYVDANGVPVKPGLYELLEWLKEHDYKIALATSSRVEKATGYIESLEIDHYFDAVIGGNMVTKGKPDPQIFRIAADKLGCGDYRKCVVFEDSANGLLAGVNAGMSVVIVPDLIDPTVKYPGLAYAKLNSLAEIPALLQV